MTVAELRGVGVRFPGGVRALDGIDLVVPTGGIMGLVGESGSGKTTLCRVLAGLMPPDAGQIEVAGREGAGFRRAVQMLLQDAAGSLSPRMRVRRLLMEPILIHGLPRAAAWAEMLALLHRLGLSGDVLDRYPHQLSGGQARRVAVARALILRPALLIADEPTAGLDVSVQGELLNLLLDLQRERGMTCLVASHNLHVVQRISSRMAVMYLGQIVEHGATATLFAAPAHPYTAALLSATPVLDPARRRTRIVLHGDPPSPVSSPSGCRFHTRCFQAQPRCAMEAPQLRPVAGREVRCHFPLTGPAGSAAPSGPASS